MWHGTKATKKKNFISPQWLRNIKAKNYPSWRPDVFFSKKKYSNLKFINDTNGNKILLTRNAKIKIISDNEEKFSLSVPFGSRIFFENKENVKANQLLAK